MVQRRGMLALQLLALYEIDHGANCPPCNDHGLAAGCGITPRARASGQFGAECLRDSKFIFFARASYLVRHYGLDDRGGILALSNFLPLSRTSNLQVTKTDFGAMPVKPLSEEMRGQRKEQT